jgi:hypothetical protein
MPVDDSEAAHVDLANLAAMPEQAVKLLRNQIEALREPITLEEKRGVRVRQIRALELLEAIATPSAKALLEELAKGMR